MKKVTTLGVLFVVCFVCVCRAEFGAMVMERIAVEFNKLQYNVSQTDHPIVEDSKPVREEGGGNH